MASAKTSGKKHNEEDFESFIAESLEKITDNIEVIRKIVISVLAFKIL